MLKKITISSIFMVFTLISCTTAAGSYNPAPGEIEKRLIDNSVENIKDLLSGGDYLKAVQLILSVDKDQPEYRDITALYPETLEALEKGYSEALDKKDFPRAILLRKSFTALGDEKSSGGPSLKELQYRYVEDLFKNGYESAAVTYFFNNLDFKELDGDQLNQLEKDFIDSRNRGALDKFFDFSVRISRNVLPETIRLINEKTDVQDMIGGTVTVWVNRGIKIENGIGIPDRGIGSGFFIDRNGYVLTNYHVISSEVDPKYEGFSRLFIKLSEDSEERIPAKVVGWDSELDIALLKTEVKPDYFFHLSRDYKAVPGDKIYAIGSPGGLKNTMTSGTVSTLNRQLQTLGDSLQIDVPINPGNSGGPLLNSDNEVIGIIFAGIEQFEGVNFAIPVSDVKEILPALYRGGEVEHPFLGCGLYERSGRLEVLYVMPGTPAAQIGLKKGDVIKSVNGASFRKIPDLQRFILKSAPQELIRIDWLRDSGNYTAVASLDKRPELPMETALARDAFDNLLVPFFGMEVERISGTGNRNIRYNILDVLPGTTADEAGLSVGDALIMRKWVADEENKILYIQIIMKTRKAGFIESAVQVGTWMAKGFFI